MLGRFVLTASLLLTTGSAAWAAGIEPPTPAVQRFERFIRASGPICQFQAAAHCVDAGWRYADINRDGGLSLVELRNVRESLRAWTGWRGDSLKTNERAAIAFGLWLSKLIGLKTFIRGYDADGDGLLSYDELLADIRLDERPLGEVLSDRTAVDRKAVARRLGPMGTLLEDVDDLAAEGPEE
jgi:hypothetical protein